MLKGPSLILLVLQFTINSYYVFWMVCIGTMSKWMKMLIFNLFCENIFPKFSRTYFMAPISGLSLKTEIWRTDKLSKGRFSIRWKWWKIATLFWHLGFNFKTTVNKFDDVNKSDDVIKSDDLFTSIKNFLTHFLKVNINVCRRSFLWILAIPFNVCQQIISVDLAHILIPNT